MCIILWWAGILCIILWWAGILCTILWSVAGQYFVCYTMVGQCVVHYTVAGRYLVAVLWRAGDVWWSGKCFLVAHGFSRGVWLRGPVEGRAPRLVALYGPAPSPVYKYLSGRPAQVYTACLWHTCRFPNTLNSLVTRQKGKADFVKFCRLWLLLKN